METGEKAGWEFPVGKVTNSVVWEHFYGVEAWLFIKNFFSLQRQTLKHTLMDKVTIGLNAGVVWRLLSNNEAWDRERLLRASGLSECELCAAIGWLAREDKIEFGHDDARGCDIVRLPFTVYL